MADNPASTTVSQDPNLALPELVGRLVKNPLEPAALAAAVGAAAAANAMDGLVSQLEDAAAAQGYTPTGVQLWFLAANLADTRLTKPERAEADLNRALAIAPESVDIMKPLANMLERMGRFADFASLLEKMIGLTLEPAQKGALLERLGRVQDGKLGMPEKALMSLQTAFRADRTRLGALRYARGIHARTGREDLAKQLLDLEADALQNSPEAPVALPRVADEYAEIASALVSRPDQHKGARDAIARALRIAPGHPRATEVGKSLDEFGPNWQEHVRRLRDEALEARDKRQAAARYLAVAQIYRDYAKDNAKALEFLEKAMLLNPGQRQALKLLEQLFREANNMEGLVGRLKQLANDSQDPQVAIEIHLTCAVVLAEQGAAKDKLAEPYAAVVKLDPANKSATNALLESHLEGHRCADAVALLDGYEASTHVVAERRWALSTAARLLDVELSDIPGAIKRLESILEMDGRDVESLESLERLYARAGRHADYARVLETLRNLAGNDRERLRCLDLLSRLYAQELKIPDQAFEVQRQAFALDPRPARGAELLKLSEQLGKRVEFGETLLAVASRMQAPNERTAMQVLAARLFAAGGNPRRAKEALDPVLAIDPNHRAALDVLSAISAKGADAKELVEVLRKRLETATAPADRRTLLARMGRLYSDELKESTDAIRCWREILNVDGNDQEALSALDGLYQQTQQWKELADTLRARIAGAPAGTDVAALRLRLARICEDNLELPGEAAEIYLQLQAAQPGHPDSIAGLERVISRVTDPVRVAAVLEPHYAASGAFRRQAEMLEVRRKAAQDATERKTLSRQQARVQEEDLRSPTDAFKTLAAALLELPGDPELAEDLARVGTRGRLFDELVETLRLAAGRLPEGNARLALLVRRAGLLQDPLAREPDAIAAHREILKDHPRQLASWNALVQLHLKRQEWPPAAEALQGAADLSEGDARTQHLVHLGRICMEQLHDFSRGASALEPVRTHGDDKIRAEALDALDTCYSLLKNAPALASVLKDRAINLSGAPRAEMDARLGELLAGPLRDAAGALAAFDRAMTMDQANARARTGLEAMLQGDFDAGVKAQATKLLEAAYRTGSDARGVARVTKARLDAAQKPEERRELCLQLAGIYARDLLQPELAVDLLAEQLLKDPADENARKELESLVRQLGKPERLAQAYQAVRAAHAGAVALEYGRRVGQLLERMGDRDGALQAYQSVLMGVPRDQEALGAMVRIRRLQREPRGLAEALENQAEIFTGSSRASALRESASLFNRVNDAPRALEVLQKAHDAQPDDITSLKMMVEVLEVVDEPTTLAQALEDLARLSPEADRAGLLVKLAKVRREKLDDPQGALTALSMVLNTRATDEALAGTVQQLDAMVREKGPMAATAASILGNHYRQSHAPAHLAGLLELHANVVGVAAERAALLDEAAQIFETELGQREAAFSAACRAVREEPTEERQRRAEALAAATRAFDAYVGVLEDLADSLQDRDPRSAAARWREIARVATERLSDRALAIRAHREVIRLAPGDSASLAALERFHRDASETGALVEVLRARAASASTPQERREALLQAARQLEESGDVAGAETTYKELMGEFPQDETLVDALDALYVRSHNGAALAALLSTRIQRAADAGRRASLGARLGRVLMETPEGLAQSFQALSRAAAEDPTQVEVVAALVALLEAVRPYGGAPVKDTSRTLEQCLRARQDWAQLPGVLETRLGVEADAKDRVAILVELAQIQEQRAKQPQVAFMTLCRALRETPLDDGLRGEAERLAQATDSLEDLAGVYEDILGQTSDLRLQSLLSRRVAWIAREKLGDRDLAMQHLRRALDLQPDDTEALADLVALLRQGEPTTELMDTLRRLANTAAAAGDSARTRGVMVELAQVAERLGDLPAALNALVQARQLGDTDRRVLSALEALLARMERPRELAEVLQAEIAVASGGAELGELRIRLSTTLLALGEPVQAARTVGQAAADSPDNPRLLAALEAVDAALEEFNVPDALAARLSVAALLEPRYEAAGDAGKLVHVLETRLEGLQEVKERVALWRRIATLKEGPLNNKELAFASLGRALKECPEDDQLRAHVERLAQASGDLESLAGLYLDVLEEQPAGPLALLYRRRLGSLLEKGLKDPARAVEQLRFALDVLGPAEDDAPEKRTIRVDVLSGMERMYRALQQSAALAGVLRQRAALEQDGRVVRSLLMEVARLQQSTPSDDAGDAVVTLAKLMELNPNDLDVLQNLQAACEAQQRWPELVDALRREAELCAARMPDRELEARLRAARVLDTALGRPDEAEKELAQVLQRQPAHEKARAYLEERLTNLPTQREATAAILKQAYTATGEWKAAIDVLEMLIGDAEAAGERVRLRTLLVEAADLYTEKLRLAGPAFGCLCRALSADRAETTLYPKLMALARVQGTMEELAEVFAEEATRADEEGAVEVAAELRETAAAIQEVELKQPERAVELYEQVLQRMPRQKTLEALQRLYERAGRWQEVEATIRRRLAVSTAPKERALLLHSLGVALGWHLGALEEAFEVLEQAHALDANRTETRLALLDICEKVQQWDRALELAESELAFRQRAEDRDGQLAAHRRLGRLLMGPLGIPEDAFIHFATLREAFPADRQVFEALETIYTRSGKWTELRRLYEEDLSREKDAGRQADLSSRLGNVLTEHLADHDSAIEKYARILELNPRDVSALDALRKIYKRAQRWEELVGVLRRLRRLHTDPSAIKQVQFDLSEALQATGKGAESVDACRRAVELEPHTDEELATLYKLFAANEAWDDCAGMLQRRVQQADHVDHRVEMFFELAELAKTRLRKPERAVAAYEGILAEEPGNIRAYECAAELFEKHGDWRRLVVLKENRVSQAATSAERVRLLREIAVLYEDKLAQKDLAFLALCRAFSENPNDRELSATLERLALATDSAEDLCGVLEDAVSRVDDTTRAIEIYLKMAELSMQPLGRPQDAEGHLKLIFDLDPENGQALDALEQVYAAQERWEDVVRVLERKLENALDDGTRRTLLGRLGQVQEEHLKNANDAVAAFKRILDIDPRDTAAIDALSRLYQATGRWQQLNTMLTRALDLASDTEQRVAIRYRMALIQEQQLQDADKAIQAYQMVLEEDSVHLPSLQALDRLYTEQRRYKDLLGVCDKLFTLSNDDNDRILLLERMSGFYSDQFSNPDGAIEQSERILEINPTYVPALVRLQQLFQDTGDWMRLVEMLQRQADLTREDKERVDLQLRVAELYALELQQPAQAEEMYKAALGDDPSNVRIIHALAALYERQGQWPQALDRLAQEADLLRGKPEAIEVFYRMGTINGDMLMDANAARTCYEAALRMEPNHLPSLQALKSLHFANKNYELYLRRLVEEAESTKDAAQKTELFVSAGSHLQEAGDVDGAVKYYERALQISPDAVGPAKPLSDIEFRRENYPRAEELLEIVVAKLDPQKEAKELCRQHYRLGYVSEKQNRDQKALKHYQRAYDIDGNYLPGLEGLGAALTRAGRWEEASKIYQSILNNHRDSLTDAEVVDYHHKLADVWDHLEQWDRSVRSLEQGLELDGQHIPSLTLLAAVQEKAGNFEDAYDALQRLVPLLVADEKVAVLQQVGVLSQQKLKDPYRAIDAFEDANRICRDDKGILNAMLGLYRETKQGPKAVEVLEDLVRLEPDEATRVRLNFQLGEVYRDEVRNDARAVQYMNAALDLDPSYLKAFESIEKLLTEKKMWRALEENYRAMIQRTPKEQIKIRQVLWQNLAQLYHKVLKDADNAIMAYSVLSKLDPENMPVFETLAELLARRQGREDEAIAAYQQILPKASSPAPALHALTRLYGARRMVDRAFCSIGALRLLKEATEEEQQAYQTLATQLPPRASRALTDKLWEGLLLHERARIPMAAISALLAKVAAPVVLREAREFGPGKRKEFERIDVEKSLVFSVKQLAGVNAVLAGPPFELWKEKNSDALPTLLPAYPLTIVVGEQSAMFKEVPPKVLWAMWGRVLSFLRTPFLLPRMLGPEKFRMIVEAAFFLHDTSARYANDPHELEKLATTFLKVEGFQAATQGMKALQNRKEPPNVDALFEGMEHTAVRASLLASNDVDVTSQVMKLNDPQSPPLPKNRNRELVLFVISDAYSELRARLGTGLKG